MTGYNIEVETDVSRHVENNLPYNKKDICMIKLKNEE